MPQTTKNIIQEAPLIFTLENLLDANQCQTLVNQSEQDHAYTQAQITVGPNLFLTDTRVRNNDRVIFDDVALAQRLFGQLRSFLPEQWHGVWRLKGLNERFRYYRYRKGQRFRMHFDGAFERHHCEKSFLTLMFYLNEGFEGGATTFFRSEEDFGRARPIHVVRPATGSALLFEHAQLHEGSEVLGGVKYVLRTDVMYELPNASPL